MYAAHPRVRLDDAAELRLPVAVEHHPVDVASAAAARSPSDPASTWEADVRVEPVGLYGSSSALIGRSP